MQLAEKYRPQTFDDVRGQDKAVTILKSAVSRNAIGGRAIWISGNTGMGKTTLARILAQTVADPIGIVEMDAGDLTVGRLREIAEEMNYRCIGERSGRAYIFNEAHGMKGETIRRLLVILESLPKHCTFIFTTTLAGQEKLFADYDDSSPLISRCLPIQLQQRDVTGPLAERALEIARAEGLAAPETTVKDCVKLLQTNRNSMRATLQDIEAGKLL